MNLGFWMIFLLIPLVGAILAMIAAAPEDMPQPNIQNNMVTEKSRETVSEPPSSLAVPVPGAENVPEMIVEEESLSIEEEHLSIEEDTVLTDVQEFSLQKDTDLEIDAEIQLMKKRIVSILAAEEDSFHHNTAENMAKVEELEKMIEEFHKMIGKPKPAPVSTAPLQVEVNIPTGSGIVGCELKMKCYIPSSVTVAPGGTVIWFNDDTVHHTVTSGTISGGHDGEFASPLFIGNSTFSHTFDEEGVYDYFCIVHPWMTGTVEVS